jgi:hypothetical protein
VCGKVKESFVKFNGFAQVMAFPGAGGASPQPSKIHKIKGFGILESVDTI